MRENTKKNFPRTFGSIYDYSEKDKPISDYHSVIEQSHSQTGQSKGTSIKTGLLVIGLFSCLVFTGGWWSWKSIPEHMKSNVLDMIPGIERVEKDIGSTQEKPIPEYVVKTREPSDPLYQIDTRTKRMLEKEMRMQRAKDQIEVAKMKMKVVEEEMKVYSFKQKTQMEIERKRQLYEAETKRMIQDILDKKNN